jgi:AraC-like DNA-binding protein
MNVTLANGKINGINIERVVRDSTFTMPTKHFHDEFELYYLLDGSRYYFIDDHSYLVEPGSLVIIDKQQIHKTSPSTNHYHDRILIEFHQASLQHLGALNDGIELHEFFKKYKGLVKLRGKERMYIESLFSDIFNEFQKKQPHFEAQVLLKLSELIIYISRIIPTHPNYNPMQSHSLKHQKANEITDYISTHYADHLSLNTLASLFFINKSYLSRIFKEITGFTVNEYINIIKIQKARDLLMTTDHSISEIADHLGYTSLTYFERIFKQHTETTPFRYRKKMLQQERPLRERLDSDA